MSENMIEIKNCDGCRFERICSYAGKKFQDESCKGFIKTIDGNPWVLVPVDSTNIGLVCMAGNPLI